MAYFYRVISIIALAFGLIFLAPGTTSAAETNGPTLRLGNEQFGASTNPMAAFMYFVPLISPEPLSIVTAPGSAQSARVTSTARHVSGNSFEAVCQIEFSGAGWQKSVFDLSYETHRHEQALKDGETLARQLKSIAVEGSGNVTIEVSGTGASGSWSVGEVRLRFNVHGQVSPVTIEMCDIKYLNGDFRQVNGIVAKVSTLTFHRETKSPKMEVTVASIKGANAGDSIWQNLKGKVEGAAANLFLPPFPVEEIGNQAMLDFGLALVTGSPSYTFPRARNLIHSDVPLDP